MSAKRTIPDNPQPWERYAERLADGWYVKRLDRADHDGRYFTTIAGPLAEADARLLVYGAKAVKSLNFIRAHECAECPCPVCYVECRTALAALEGKS